MLRKFVIAYIDDILMYSLDQESHVAHIKKVLPKLLNNHLFVKAVKSEFHVTQISFLGHIINVERVIMD